jgi:hypothetical protein
MKGLPNSIAESAFDHRLTAERRVTPVACTTASRAKTCGNFTSRELGRVSAVTSWRPLSVWARLTGTKASVVSIARRQRPTTIMRAMS